MKRKDFVIKEDSGKEVKLSVRYPLNDDFENSEREYARKVASLVKENAGKRLLLRSQVNDFLKSAGVWTDEDQAKVEGLNAEVDSILAKLRKGGLKISEGRELCIKVMDKRKEIVQVMSKRQIFDNTTIESMAEDERMDYLIYACTVYSENGSPYWDSFEDMKNDKLSEAYNRASVAAYDVIFNVNSEFEKNLPENKWLKKYSFVDDDLNYTDRKTGKRVDRDGNPIEQLEEDIKKRIENLNGDIEEEQPFIDDETNEPIVVDEKKEETVDSIVNQ
jgi:hypothetical protein